MAMGWLNSANFPVGSHTVSSILPDIRVLVALCGAVLSSGLALSQVSPEYLGEGGSRYQRTVLSLRTSTPGIQADFANTALMELVEVYMAEADLARNQAEQGVSSTKLRGWSRAVNQYASQLMLVLEDIELGLPVKLQFNAGNLVTVMIGGRAVILSHPRADQQANFEQRVLLGFCGRNDCRLLTANGSEAEPIPVSAPQAEPVWTFTAAGPVCAHAGIEVRFESARNLARSRITCKQLLQEMMTLANEIAWQRRHDVAVEWNKLSVRPTPQRPEHLVQLNDAGDSLLVTIPLIYGSPDLLDHIAPWIERRASGKETPGVQLDAVRYGWERTGQ